jgi:HlyD family secretion protein
VSSKKPRHDVAAAARKARLGSPGLRRRRWGGALPIVIIVLVVMMVVAVAWGVSRLNNGKDAPAAADAAKSGDTGSPDWFTVQRTSFDRAVLATGELESAQKTEVKCEVEGTTTIIELVDEGTTVKKGDPLVKLADDELKGKIEEETLAMEQAKAAKIAADQAMAIAQSEAKSLQDAAELKVALADLDLAKWKNGTDPQMKQTLDLALEKATREKARAERDLDLSIDLEKQKFISKNELEDSNIKVLETTAALAKATLDIDVYNNYTRPKEMRQANSDLSQAKAELDRTIRTNVSNLAKAKADQEAKDRSLKIREDRLTKLTDQLAKTSITAPCDGLVVYATSVGSRSRRYDSSPIAEGSTIRYNETIILLPDTSKMVASLRVHESMVRSVEKGQKGTITVDARRGAPIVGKVSDKSVLAVDAGWSNPDLREYTVRVELPTDLDKSLKPGMRCSGEIFIGRVEDVLAVPVQAVFTEGRNRFCYVSAGPGKVRKQPIEVGRSSETLAEVVKGLSESERVLLRLPRPGEVAGE